MENRVTLSEYPSCCGMFVLTNFFNNPTPDMHNKSYCCSRPCSACRKNKEQAKVYADKTHQAYLARIRAQTSTFIEEWLNRKSYLLATLNLNEEGDVGHILRELGFKVLIPMCNNPTGTSIVTYIYNLCEPKAVVQKSIMKRKRTDA